MLELLRDVLTIGVWMKFLGEFEGCVGLIGVHIGVYRCMMAGGPLCVCGCPITCTLA